MPARGKALDLGWLVVASVLAFALWVIPVTRPLGIPLVFLNTHIHELWHALAALATGGQVQFIKVFADGSGVTPVGGSFLPLTASAGYVGASIVGGALIAASRRTDTAQRALMTLGIALAVSMVVFVRGDLVGWIAGGFWTVACLWGAQRLKPETIAFVTAFLGVQQCLTSVQALLVLFHLSVGTSVHSDALLMQQATGLPSVLWAGLWIAMSVVSMGFGAHRALKSGSKTS